jgi:D-xylose 1-dehydrogenase (NADP+, D-xylono-1,5-lactone-forming)
VLRWGVLGAAWIAGRAVLPAIAASSNGRLVAIASRDVARAEQMAAPYRGVRVGGSYDALLADPDVEAVYIPLINSEHRDWTIRALKAGKHVLCEKPLALNARDAAEMASVAETAQRLLMEGFMYRFHADMQDFVAHLVDPLHVHATFGFTVADPANPRLQAALGGGALMDVGCYTVSVARWILGEPQEVLAAARMANGVDLTVDVLLQFPGGQTASLWASLESPETQELTVVTPDRVHHRERPFTAWRDPHDPYRLMVESFGESVLRNEPVAIPLSESIANLKVIDRIREVALRAGKGR